MALSDREQVRLFAVGDSASTIMTDDEVDIFLSRNSGNIYLAAADMCLAIAGSAALVAKAQSSGQFSSTKTSIPDEFRKNAEALRLLDSDTPYSVTVENYTYPWGNAVLEDEDDV